MAKYRYRDTRTGRLAKRATYERSRARGGVRYVREKIGQGYLVRLGYRSNKDNGFVLEIEINPHKHLSDANVIALCLKLIRVGHFDDSPENSAADLQWCAGNVNFHEIVSRTVNIKPGRAVLVYFEREQP